MAIIHDGNSVPISTNNPLPTQLLGSDVQIPVDIQSRYATTIQTHTAVLVAPSGTSSSAWVDCNGFETVSITSMNDAATTHNVDLGWSHDGVSTHGYEYNPPGTAQFKAFTVPTKARYLKLFWINGDAAPHTVSARAYLKA